MSLTTVFGPLVMNGSFAYFTSAKAPFHFPGIHFILGAICMGLSIVLIKRIFVREKNNPAAAHVLENTGGFGNALTLIWFRYLKTRLTGTVGLFHGRRKSL